MSISDSSYVLTINYYVLYSNCSKVLMIIIVMLLMFLVLKWYALSFDKDKKLIACNLAYDYLNDLKFTVPEDLKIGEVLRIKTTDARGWCVTKVCKVYKISKGSFTVIYDDDTIQVVRSKIYRRNV